MRFLLVTLLFLAAPALAEAERPRLFFQSADLALFNEAEQAPAAFAVAMEEASRAVQPYLDQLPDVPVPVDPGGGYTHEQHKRNGNIIRQAGLLYLLTGESAYAELSRDLLLAYGELYPGLGSHPVTKSSTPGRLFWQSLNESVWLLTAIQGYDAIHGFLSAAERERIEQSLLRPLVSFLSTESPEVFNKIHNHGTWAVAAVGLTGFVIDDDIMVEQALLGLDKDGKAGFLKQIDVLFSPDGYYSEGPYYQRYALMPFLLFAKGIDLNQPERKIFEYRDGVLLKAIDALIQMSYGGLFFPINDAITDKGIDTIELCHGVAIAWTLTSTPGLLSIAQQQGRIALSGDGLRLATALASETIEPYPYSSKAFKDGPDGDRGMLGILRSGPGEKDMALVFKATAQGLGHGHFDRLAWLLYDNGNEVVPDYGAARYLNVEAKHGGRYLPENLTWAKQTVAHNTLVVDETSHFDADWKVGEKRDISAVEFHSSDGLQVVAARMENAYEDVAFGRRLAMLKHPALVNPVVIDILDVEAKEQHTYDLPLYFNGQITRSSHPMKVGTGQLLPMGKANGYQHLWKKAETRVEKGELFQLTWLEGGRFYTWSALAHAPMTVFITETGANDPEFNLRPETAVMLRVEGAANHTFVGVLEPHGRYDGTREFTSGGQSAVAAVTHSHHGKSDQLVITTRNGNQVAVDLAADNPTILEAE